MSEDRNRWKIGKSMRSIPLQSHALAMALGQGRPFSDGKHTSWGYSKKTPLNSDITKSISNYLEKDALEIAKSLEHEVRKNFTRQPFIKKWAELLEASLNKTAPDLQPSLEHQQKMRPCPIALYLARNEGFDVNHLKAMPTINTLIVKNTTSLNILWRPGGLELNIRRGRPEGNAVEQGWYWKNGKFHINAGSMPLSLIAGLNGKTLDRLTGQEEHMQLIITDAGQDSAAAGPLVLAVKLTS